MKKAVLLIFLLFDITGSLFSNTTNIDSLKKYSGSKIHDTLLIQTLNRIGKAYEFIDQDSAKLYILRANKLAVQKNYLPGQGISNMYLGYLAEDVSSYDTAISYYTKALGIFNKIGDKSNAAEQIKLIGEATKYKGDLKGALNYFQKALTIYEQINSTDGIAGLDYSMGTLYKDMGRYDKAMECYSKALEIYMKEGSAIDQANLITAIGIIHNINSDFKAAKKNYAEAEALYISQKYDNGLSNLYTWMAITAYNEKDLDKSLQYFTLSHDIYKKINSVSGLMYVYDNIGSIHAEKGDYEQAIEWQKKSLNMALSLKGMDNIRYAYEMLSNTYAKKGDFKNAYENYVLFIKYKDSLMNENTFKQISELDKKYETEKKDKELLLKDAEILKQSAKAEKQAAQKNYFIVGFIAMLLVSGFIYRGYKQKKTANDIIEKQKKEVEYQKLLLETKQKEILDSIHYAKRIQQSLLPTEKYIEKKLKG